MMSLIAKNNSANPRSWDRIQACTDENLDSNRDGIVFGSTEITGSSDDSNEGNQTTTEPRITNSNSSSSFPSEECDNPFDEWSGILSDSADDDHSTGPIIIGRQLLGPRAVLEMWDDPQLDLVSRQANLALDQYAEEQLQSFFTSTTDSPGGQVALSDILPAVQLAAMDSDEDACGSDAEATNTSGSKRTREGVQRRRRTQNTEDMEYDFTADADTGYSSDSEDDDEDEDDEGSSPNRSRKRRNSVGSPQRGRIYQVDSIDDSVLWDEVEYQKLIDSPMSRIGMVS
jgi:hypothetical protein